MSRSAPDTTAKINAVIESAKLHAIDVLEFQFAWAAENCESPIEKLFLTQLLHPEIGDTFDTRVEMMTPKSRLLEHCVPPPFPGLWVYPQIKIGAYRVDFLLVHTWYGDMERLIVECDGHDFHERSKEQARRDKARDRYLVSAGHRLVRYTGSEIYADVASCVIEAVSILMNIAE